MYICCLRHGVLILLNRQQCSMNIAFIYTGKPKYSWHLLFTIISCQWSTEPQPQCLQSIAVPGPQICFLSVVLQLGYTLRSCEELIENTDAWSHSQYILNQVMAGAQASVILRDALVMLKPARIRETAPAWGGRDGQDGLSSVISRVYSVDLLSGFGQPGGGWKQNSLQLPHFSSVPSATPALQPGAHYFSFMNLHLLICKIDH